MNSLVELRPNKDLLDANFSGYKLSLDSIPIYRHILQNGVDIVRPSEDQFSFLHVKVFGLQNHLYHDPWSRDYVYYIDKQWRVQRSLKNDRTELIEGIVEVWEMPSNHPRKAGHYNTSLCFPSAEFAVVADGAGTLHLVFTGSRVETSSWKILFSDEVCGKERSFIIIDSRTNNLSKRLEFHILLLWIDDLKSDEENDKALSFVTKLEWITLSEGENQTWSVQCIRQLSGSGSLDYIAFEPNCESLYISSVKPFKFISDSENPIENKTQEEQTVSEKKPCYIWLQTQDDITVWFQLEESTSKTELNIKVDSTNLKVMYKENVLLEGTTWQCLDASLSTWTLNRGKLEVTLVKGEQGPMWEQFIKEDSRGEQILDPALVEEIHTRLAHLCSEKEVTDSSGNYPPSFNSQQLEECDELPMESSHLIRLSASTHDVTHRINLGGHQWLFNASLKADDVPAICLRHDVDGCLWQLSPPQDKNWPCIHTGTFSAFGYVQASKQQKKFIACAPDMSYVAICEASRHIYIYRQPAILQTELRNRRTGQHVAHVAKQQLANLDCTAEILGVHASVHNLYVLTKETLYTLHINYGSNFEP